MRIEQHREAWRLRLPSRVHKKELVDVHVHTQVVSSPNDRREEGSDAPYARALIHPPWKLHPSWVQARALAGCGKKPMSLVLGRARETAP